MSPERNRRGTTSGPGFRLALLFLGLLVGLSGVSGCRDQSETPRAVLYTSADDFLAREIVADAEASLGIDIEMLGDTEATKTTGLMLRLINEKDKPRADVWWSSEPFGTIRLAREGVLAPVTSEHETEFEGGWPDGLKAERWYGFAQRARVIAFNTDRVQREDVPTRLRDLTDPRWKGRVGMARPQFGTTRGHMGALAEAFGEAALESWLSAMKENGLRIYDGNSTCVRAVARGEIDLCLTDTDDVWGAQRNGWPVDLIYEQPDEGGEPVDGLPSLGALVMPNTVGIVAGGPNPDQAKRLFEHLLSAEVERRIAQSDSHNVPLRPGVASEFPSYEIPTPWRPDLSSVADAIPAAMSVCERVLD